MTETAEARRDRGAAAMIHLQGMANIEYSQERALKEWDAMSAADQDATLEAYAEFSQPKNRTSGISAEEVHRAFAGSMPSEQELSQLFGTDDRSAISEKVAAGELPPELLLIEGVTHGFVVVKTRLEEQREKVLSWLKLLPTQFRHDAGGGWSFLNACCDVNEEQWGEHRDIEALLALALGLGLAEFCLPRESWQGLPGGVPYFRIMLPVEQTQAER